MSRVTAIILVGYLHHRLSTRLLIITVITPLPTKSPARQKCQRTGSWRERGNYRHADASAMLLRLMQKYTKELADAKAENDALRDDVAAGRRRLHNISGLSVSA